MASWHELVEASPGGVATSSGIEPLNGRDRAKVLAAQPESYRHFRQIWDHVRASLASVVPAEGTNAGNLEFRVKRIAAGEPGG